MLHVCLSPLSDDDIIVLVINFRRKVNFTLNINYQLHHKVRRIIRCGSLNKDDEFLAAFIINAVSLNKKEYCVPCSVPN